MIVVVGGIKGGSGKTTIATNLAVYRSAKESDVLLVDADDQQSSYTFSQLRLEHRPNNRLTCVCLGGVNVGRECRQMSAKYRDIIVDVGGRDTASQRAALSVADLILLPFKPRTYDMATIHKVRSMVAEAQAVNDHLRVATMINMADPKGSDNREAAAWLESDTDLPFSEVTVVNRKAFSNSAALGCSVAELQPEDWKAKHEMGQLYDFVYNRATA
jgi:chromosome partitioning protein